VDNIPILILKNPSFKINFILNLNEKPKSDYVWSKYFPITEIQHSEQTSTTKMQMWPPLHEEENETNSKTPAYYEKKISEIKTGLYLGF
jgi:hypothetical protein